MAVLRGFRAAAAERCHRIRRAGWQAVAVDCRQFARQLVVAPSVMTGVGVCPGLLRPAGEVSTYEHERPGAIPGRSQSGRGMPLWRRRRRKVAAGLPLFGFDDDGTFYLVQSFLIANAFACVDDDRPHEIRMQAAILVAILGHGD